MLEVSKLSRSYGKFLAVNDVSFNIRSGEIVGLLGHNGAGKTTIMKMLSGYLEPDQGSVVIDGIDLAGNPKQAQQRLGYLPENLPIYPEMTVADFLDYAADLKGLQGNAKITEIQRAVKATELGSKLFAPIATLSRGYKQRVGVAQAILGKPRLLILDEPTNGLDPTQTDHMRALIRNIAEHATVILSTHIMQEVDALCDRVLIINAGALVIDEKLADLKQSRELALVTSLGREDLQQALAKLSAPKLATSKPLVSCKAEVAPLSEGPWSHYTLSVPDAGDFHHTASAVAEAVIAAGGSVATLQPIVRNLETLFREVSHGSTHAAMTPPNNQESQHAA